MKKSFLSFAVIAMMAVTTSFAQSSLVATLVHNDTITAFYGPDALLAAHSAAVNGDTINLSEGTFYSSDISKGLTLRGAGMTPDTVAHTGITTIAGDFTIANNGNRVTFEGIYSNHTIRYSGNVSNASFVKCRLNTIGPYSSDGYDYSSGYTQFNNRLAATFVNCRIAGVLSLYSKNIDQSSVECINSIVNAAQYHDGVNNRSRNFLFRNCIVKYNNGSAPGGATSSYYNCIFIDNPGTAAFDASVTAYNCVDVSDSTLVDKGVFKNISNASNKAVTGYTEIFKTYKGGDILNTEDFELTETAKTTYLGGDDKQVGIYGGNMAFKPTLDFPQITKFEVADKTTSDGKLNITIEVKNAN